MKLFCGWVSFCLCILVILFKIDNVCETEKLKKEWEFTRQKLERENESLKKEIRVLRADLYVYINGYETEFEE